MYELGNFEGTRAIATPSAGPTVCKKSLEAAKPTTRTGSFLFSGFQWVKNLCGP